MDSKFEEMFEEKFGSTFSTESMKFLNKALMYEGWLLHKKYVESQIPDFLLEQNKGE